MAVERQFCDFCLKPLEGRYFTHFTDRFFVPGDDEIPSYADVDGEWAVCPVCHAFVVEGDQAGLLAHTPMGFDVNENRYHQQIIAAFFANYHGTWKEDGADPPPRSRSRLS